MSALSLPQIAVTGAGCISGAGGNSITAIATIRDGIARNRILTSAFFPKPFGAPCFLAQEDLLEGVAENLAELGATFSGLNRTLLLALTAIGEALSGAGISVEELRSKRVGIALGTTVGCTFHNETYFVEWKKGLVPDSKPLHNYLSSNLAERLQHVFGVQGPRAVVTNACASGTDAIGMAKNWLEYGLCDIAIAGGADELSRIACHGFKSLMLVSEKSCQPFDLDRKGLNLGEGAGVLVMETAAHAKASNRDITGWIRGYGVAGDAHHPTAPHPDGRGLKLAVTKALADANVSTEDIAMINAHGTGTPANDRAETKAIFDLGFNVSSMPVVSTKGATGHTLGAAGGLEAVFTLLSLNKGVVSGTVGCLNPDPEFPFPVLKHGEHERLMGRIGLSQSLAFGGSNSALVIEGAGS